MEEKEITEIVEKETKKLYQDAFLRGTLAGWNACIVSINKEIAGMTSAKKIKKAIFKKIEESRKRLEENNMKEKEEEVDA